MSDDRHQTTLKSVISYYVTER